MFGIAQNINTVMCTAGFVSLIFLLSWPLLRVMDKIATWRKW